MKQRLMNQIRINRLRLSKAVVERDSESMLRFVRLLTHLHAEFFDLETKGVVVSQVETKYLVFSELHPDGTVMDKVSYRNLVRGMDQCDRASHTAVEVDGDMQTDVEQALLIPLESKSNKRAG